MRLFIAFVLFLLLNISPGFSQTDVVRDVIAASQAGLTGYLEKIPAGSESDYGFRNRDEFSLVKIGKAYRVCTLTKEFYSEKALSGENYLAVTDEWRVSITVNEEARVLLIVAKVNSHWKAVGIGAAIFAKELGEYEGKYSSPASDSKILRVYLPECDFFITSSENSPGEMKVYPLKSARLAIGNMAEKPYYTLHEVLDYLKINP
ncbi:MAG: hypothetical protein NTW49_11385 [Bacteroidia bacterium]|nr:hypothetical protein [Bacteroidia bacterium]